MRPANRAAVSLTAAPLSARRLPVSAELSRHSREPDLECGPCGPGRTGKLVRPTAAAGPVFKSPGRRRGDFLIQAQHQSRELEPPSQPKVTSPRLPIGSYRACLRTTEAIFLPAYGRSTWPDQFAYHLIEHRLVVKEHGAQCFILRRGRDVPVDGAVGEDGLDLAFPHLTGMTTAVKKNEPPDPLDVCLFRAVGVLVGANRRAAAVENTRTGRDAPSWAKRPGASTFNWSGKVGQSGAKRLVHTVQCELRRVSGGRSSVVYSYYI